MIQTRNNSLLHSSILRHFEFTIFMVSIYIVFVYYFCRFYAKIDCPISKFKKTSSKYLSIILSSIAGELRHTPSMCRARHCTKLTSSPAWQCTHIPPPLYEVPGTIKPRPHYPGLPRLRYFPRQMAAENPARMEIFELECVHY